MGVFERGEDNPVGRTNVAPIGEAPDEQAMYAFSYVRRSTTERGISFVIAGGGEVRGGEITPETIVRYGEVTQDAMAEKAGFVLDVMEKRLTALNLSWEDARAVNVYTKHSMEGPVLDQIQRRTGRASIHGIHRFATAPPVEGIEFEMDVKGPTWEVALP